MDEKSSPRRRRVAGAVGLVAAGAIAGGILASTLVASAVGNDTHGRTSPMTAVGQGHRPMPMGPAPVRGDEKPLSSGVASQLKAKALKAVPGGTVSRVETDAGDAAYEAHMTKSDGTPVTVKFDRDLNLVKVEDGMGAGDPAPSGAGHGPGGPTGSAIAPGSTTG